MSISTQCIHGNVMIARLGRGFSFTAVYGLHTMEERKTLWDKLMYIHSTQQGPWVAMVQETETRDFNEYLIDTATAILKSVGRNFTWSNGSVFSKIDWAIVNVEWMINLPHLEVCIMDPGCCDHSPLTIRLADEPQRPPRPFRFYHCLPDHYDFNKIVDVA
ncbi:hypothetical protein KY290_010556 [Solanum tuberosum]|uniref:Endonuclease/exonuclease/phosphatase domain-containing protein n=1 Tax=Solanum tuberosum TaxID=4113 RepID=A0ABQ7VY76_SOLTU|nr:hypothetical protein KY290_010556 [Solanum tuberosum]